MKELLAFWANPTARRKFVKDMHEHLQKNPNQFFSQMQFPEPDKLMIDQLLDQPDVAKGFADFLLEAFRSGTGGVNRDIVLHARPWRFRLEDIRCQVHLWHGELDMNVAVSVARYIADAIPNCRARFIENEGHLSCNISTVETF